MCTMEHSRMNIIGNAVALFEQAQYREAFAEFVQIYHTTQEHEERQEIFHILEQAYYLPNETAMQSTYAANCERLAHYPYQWGLKPLPLEALPVQVFPVADGEYCLYDKNTETFSDLYRNDSAAACDYLCRELDRPIMRENDCNEFHLRFLQDNVRLSEDFGGDNHVYLYYSSDTEIAPLLIFCDLGPLIEDKKFVFLIGHENRKRYPVNFKKEFNIEYKKAKPVRLNEIKRLFVFYTTTSHCGNAMIDSLLDSHPNLLTVKEFGMSAFSSFYETCLCGQSVQSFIQNLVEHQREEKYRFIFTFFNKIYPESDALLPQPTEFLNALQDALHGIDIPTKQQWFAAFFLANAQSLHRELNARIAPAIFHAPHTVWNCDPEAEMEKIQDIYHSFPYTKIFMAVRDPSLRAGGEIKYELKCRELYRLRGREPLEMLFFPHGEWSFIDWRRIYYEEHSLFRPEQMAVIRFEDIKLEPQKTLSMLCRFLDIPWSDTLLHSSHNGAHTIYKDAGTTISDFDPAPLSPEYYREYLNEFDRFRIGLLYLDFYAPWKYELPVRCHIPFDRQEIKRLFTLPFQFEGPSAQWSQEYREKRKEILSSLDELLNELEQFSERKRSGEIHPVSMIDPRREDGENG